MAILDASAFAMMSALRDHIQSRIADTEDFRAFVALSREISAYEALPRAPAERGAPARRSTDPGYPRIVVSEQR